MSCMGLDSSRDPQQAEEFHKNRWCSSLQKTRKKQGHDSNPKASCCEATAQTAGPAYHLCYNTYSLSPVCALALRRRNRQFKLIHVKTECKNVTCFFPFRRCISRSFYTLCWLIVNSVTNYIQQICSIPIHCQVLPLPA